MRITSSLDVKADGTVSRGGAVRTSGNNVVAELLNVLFVFFITLIMPSWEFDQEQSSSSDYGKGVGGGGHSGGGGAGGSGGRPSGSGGRPGNGNIRKFDVQAVAKAFPRLI